MTPDLLFRLCSATALLSWILLIFSGFPSGTRVRYVSSMLFTYIVPGLLSAVYLAIILTHWAGHQGGFSSVSDVQKLFGNPWLLVAGWVHYLAFDLFVGAWQVRDARQLAIPHWWTIPSLILTFLFGPIGFLVYVLLRSMQQNVAPHRRVTRST